MLVTLESIHKEVVKKVKTLGIKVYGNEIKDGYKTPSFFIQFIPIQSDSLKKNIYENLYTVEILYLSENNTSAENTLMYDKLRALFIEPLVVGSRKVLPLKLRRDIDNDEHMSFKFDLSFYDSNLSSNDETVTAKEVKINTNIKEV